MDQIIAKATKVSADLAKIATIIQFLENNNKKTDKKKEVVYTKQFSDDEEIEGVEIVEFVAKNEYYEVSFRVPTVSNLAERAYSIVRAPFFIYRKLYK